MIYNLRECQPPARVKWVGSCGSCATSRGYGAAGADFREVTFYGQASQTLQIITETDVIFDPVSPKLHLGAQGTPNGPTGIPKEPKGCKSDHKESRLRAQVASNWPTSISRKPKGGQSHPKKSKTRSRDIQRRATNHKTIYT